MNNHTPLPWHSDDKDEQFVIVRTNDKIIYVIEESQPTPEDRANASFIVKACNSHYELLEYLKLCLGTFEKMKLAGVPTDFYVITLKSLIQKTESL